MFAPLFTAVRLPAASQLLLAAAAKAGARYFHVVVGLVFNKTGELLVAERQAHKFQGGRFEFPGGKVEVNELPFDALVRELHEEIGIDVLCAEPWGQFQHTYADRNIFLDVWRVTEFSGDAHGKEGQEVRWVSLQTLKTLSIPDANRDIVNRLCK